MTPARALLFACLALVFLPACSTDDVDTNANPTFGALTATPDPVARGDGVVFTAAVSDDDTVTSVKLDLSSLGLTSAADLHDDGVGADSLAGDGIWSLSATIPVGATAGATNLPVTATDNEGASASGSLSFTIKTNTIPVISNPLADPFWVKAGNQVLFTVDVTDDGTVSSVIINLTTLGGSATQPMYDDGTNGDVASGNGTWSYLYTIPSTQTQGLRSLPVTVTDDEGDTASSSIGVSIVPNAVPTVTNEAVTPATVYAGDTVTFTADIADSDGSIVAATIDLSSVGGSATATLYDDGTNGDSGAGDGTYSFQYTIPTSATAGSKSLTVDGEDNDGAHGTGAVTFTLGANQGPTLTSATASPPFATGEETVVFTVNAQDPQTVSSVTIDLQALGGGAAVAMLDDGIPPDASSGDNIYTCHITLAAHIPPGLSNPTVTATDGASATSNTTIPVQVVRLRVERSEFLYGVTGVGSGNMFATGERATGIHYDGNAWRMVNLKNPESNRMQYDAFMLASGELFTAGKTGSASIFDGSAYAYIGQIGGTTSEYRDVWASSTNNAYFVGTSGQIYSWNGSGWSLETGTGTVSYTAIWGASATDIVAVGINNNVYHYYGGAWNAETVTATANDCFGVWGDATGTTWFLVTGDGGTLGDTSAVNAEIWKGTGTGGAAITWTQIATLTGVDLYDIHGSSLTDIWAVGTGGAVYQCTNGSAATPTFNPVTSNTMQTLYGVWSNGSNDVYVVGANGSLLHYNGTSFSQMIDNSTYQDSWGCTAPTATDAWTVDLGGNIRYYNSGTWSPDHTHTSGLRGVWAPSGSTANVYAVGDNGDVLHRQGTSWATMAQVPSTGGGNLYTVWGTSSTSIFVGGTDGATGDEGIWSWNGTAWSAVHTGLSTTGTDIIWTIGGDPTGADVYAGGGGNRLYKYGGSNSWADITAQLSGASGDINGIWASASNDVYVVTGSQVFHYGGTSWSQVTLPTTPPSTLTGVCGTSASDVYVVGRDATIYRFDGSTWRQLPFVASYDLLECAASGNLVLFTGEKGEAYRYEK